MKATLNYVKRALRKLLELTISYYGFRRGDNADEWWRYYDWTGH